MADEDEKGKEPTAIPVRGMQTFQVESVPGYQQKMLSIGAILCIGASLFCFLGAAWWLFKFDRAKAGFAIDEPIGFVYMPAIMTFAAAVILALFGYALFSAAGAATRQVIPRHDYDLLSSIISQEKEKAIELYIRLNSMSGITGFFTKIGITGLPLATIVLTLIFTYLGVSDPSHAKLLDFANLTLGAFLGSYVQRNISGSIGSSPISKTAIVPVEVTPVKQQSH